MYHRILYAIIILILTTAAKNAYTQENPPEDKPWKSFSLVDLILEKRKKNTRYLRFLDETSMSMGLYELEAGGVDGQNPHDVDEVYFIVEGKAMLSAGKKEYDVNQGDIVFVKAKVPHKFINIEKNMRVLVIFSKTETDPEAEDSFIYHMSDILAEKDPEKNIWNQFLNVPTMRYGLYILPDKLGGDTSQTHQVDEVNLVVSGMGMFKMGEDEIPVASGSIIYVKEGIGHYFHSLETDLEILILFQKKK